MQLALALTVFSVASVFADCDFGGLGEGQRNAAMRICKLEQEIVVLENAVQELLQRLDITVASDEESTMPQKRKNEFIRFGKRKNEFIRFGKRKNEFIRFGRSDPAMVDDYSVEKRKNEFIRFG